MKLHVFNDSHGFFLNLAVSRIKHQPTGEHRFVNLNDKTIYPNSQVTYLKKSFPAFNHYVRALPAIEEVIFYPLDEIGAHFHRALILQQPAVRLTWVFWGYEFYHRREKYLDNFSPFSLSWYNQQQTISRKTKLGIVSAIKKIIRIPQYDPKLLDDTYARVGRFFSFLEQDFLNISREKPQLTCRWSQIAFLSLREMTEGLEPASVLQPAVMVGHAATLTLNHYEALELLANLKIPLNVFMTLEYGDMAYREKLKEKASALFPGSVQVLEKRLPLKDYYRHISTFGFAIFSFHFQEGLANLIFLLWNGCKLFLRKDSAVYLEFRRWGMAVFNIENELNADAIRNFLSPEERKKNRNILERVLSDEAVGNQWAQLIAG